MEYTLRLSATYAPVQPELGGQALQFRSDIQVVGHYDDVCDGLILQRLDQCGALAAVSTVHMHRRCRTTASGHK